MTSMLILSLLACVADVGAGKTAAEVADAPTEEAAPADKAAPAGNTLAIDTAASKIHALGAKVSATHPIDFKTWSGKVTVDGDSVTDIDFEVEMKSMESNHPKLTGHLMAEDFFFVEKFPTASFDGSKVTAGSDAEGMTHTVVGKLTIRGASKQVTFPAKIAVDGKMVKANAEFTINRQDFGVTYPGRADDLVQDNVVLTVKIKAPRA